MAGIGRQQTPSRKSFNNQLSNVQHRNVNSIFNKYIYILIASWKQPVLTGIHFWRALLNLIPHRTESRSPAKA